MNHIIKRVKKHHIHWAVLVAFAVANLTFVLGKIEEVYGASVNIIPPEHYFATWIENDLCPSQKAGKAVGEDFECFKIGGYTQTIYSDLPNASYTGGIWFAAPRKPVFGIPASVTDYYSDYTKVWPNDPATIEYAVSAEDSPLKFQYTSSINGSVIQNYSHVCSGLPVGWGCYYVKEYITGCMGCTNNPEIKYSAAIPAYPPDSIRKFTLTCTGVAQKNGQGDDYTNIVWTATPKNAGSGTVYKWGGDAANSGAGPVVKSYVYPSTGRVAEATVSATTVVGGKTVDSKNTATCKVTPPKNTVALRCSAKVQPRKDPVTGQFTNVMWTATPGVGGGDIEYSWSGDVLGNSKVVYSYIEPGSPAKKESATITGSGTFSRPDGGFERILSSNNQDNTCYSPAIAPLTVKCSGEYLPNGGTDANGNRVNIKWTAKAMEGTADVTNNVSFEWTGNATGTDKIIYGLGSAGENVRQDIRVKLISGDESSYAGSSCVLKIPLPTITAVCKPTDDLGNGAGKVTWNAFVNYVYNGVKYANVTDNISFVWQEFDGKKWVNQNTVATSTYTAVKNFAKAPGAPVPIRNRVEAYFTPDAFPGAENVKPDPAMCESKVCNNPQFFRSSMAVTIFGGIEDIKVDKDKFTDKKVSNPRYLCFVGSKPCVSIDGLIKDKSKLSLALNYGGGGAWDEPFALPTSDPKRKLFREHSWDEEYVAYPLYDHLPNGEVDGDCNLLSLRNKCIQMTVNGQTKSFPIWDRGPSDYINNTLDVSMGVLRSFGLNSPEGVRATNVKLIDKVDGKCI